MNAEHMSDPDFDRPWSCACTVHQERYRADEHWTRCQTCGESIPPITEYPRLWHLPECGLED